ncbi:MAG: glycosyltransferase [bacterium]|nr:glycosyltransferase [bacterium]
MEDYNELISIVTASYNYENYIKETIESVLCQTYKNWELIIVDDGSKDNSLNVISEYCKKDERIKLYTHENNSNKGLAQTIQYGIKLSKGRYVAFLESDDTITPDYLEKKAKVISENPNTALVFNDVNIFGYEERVKGLEDYKRNHDKILSSLVFPTNILKDMRNINLLATFSAVMVKKDILETLDFNSPIKASLDWYLWFQVIQKNDVFYIDEMLTNWRMHEDSYSKELKRPDNKEILDSELLKNCFILYKNPIQRSIRNFLAYMVYLKKTCFKWHPKEKVLIIFGKQINY